MSTVVDVSGLSAGYDGAPLAIDNVTLAVEEGDFLGIIGPNGAGKSTLFACMLGLLHGYDGTIRFFGRDIRDSPSYRRRVGYVEQRPAFDRNFPATVREVVRMGAARGLGGWPWGKGGGGSLRRSCSCLCRRPWGRDAGGADGEDRVDRILQDMWIHELADRRIGELSGGQLQRAFIAKALAAEPRVMVLDEPVTGVDAASTDLFYGILRTLNRSGMTIVWSSHDMDAVGSLATRLACLNRRLFFHGDPRRFFSDKDLVRQYSEASMQEHMQDHCCCSPAEPAGQPGGRMPQGSRDGAEGQKAPAAAGQPGGNGGRA